MWVRSLFSSVKNISCGNDGHGEKYKNVKETKLTTGRRTCVSHIEKY